MKKKVLGIMMCFCLMAGILSGCGADSESMSDNVEQPEISEAENAGTENSFEPPETEADSGVTTQPDETEEIVYYLAKETEYVECSYPVGYHIEHAYEYDESGRLIKVSSFGDDSLNPETGEMNHIEGGTEYGYDEAGNIIYKETWREAGRFTVSMNKRIEYEYDALGNLISTSDGEKYEYDDAGRLISSTNNNGSETRYKYDEAGRLVFTETGYFHTEYEYNEEGNLSKKTEYNDDEEFKGIIEEIEYDIAGNETKVTYYKTSQGQVTYMREYDTVGNIIKEDEYQSGENEPSSHIEYEYDEKGRLVKIITTTYKDYNGNPITEPSPYEYTFVYEEEYDDADNLIKLSTYEGGKLSCWVEYEYAVR